MQIKDIYWLAGFLEGEGSFSHQGRYTRVTASQMQKEPLERVARLVGGRIHKYGEKRINEWGIYSSRAIGLIMTLFSIMSPRRQEQMRGCIDSWKSRPTAAKYRAHCIHGHAFNAENTYIYPKTGWRGCRLCWNRRHKNAKAKK